MAAKGERDAITGVETTGHEWDGIKELNNPLPRWWVYTFYASILFAVVWWVLYPSWPWTSGYLPGLLGSNQRQDLERRLEVARAAQAQWTDRIASVDAAAILNDPELVQFAIAGGEHSFKSNCAPCHGLLVRCGLTSTQLLRRGLKRRWEMSSRIASGMSACRSVLVLLFVGASARACFEVTSEPGRSGELGWRICILEGRQGAGKAGTE